MKRLATLAALLALAAPAAADTVRQEIPFTADDGTELYAFITGEAPLQPRPLIVEFTPYAPTAAGVFTGINTIEVHTRGTGLSNGSWDIMGAREQRDISEFLAWACKQPWSDGKIGLYGQSASAISAYAAMRRPLPCVKTAVLWAGTTDLYHDIGYVGGIPNQAIADGFGALVLSPYLQSLLGRLQRAPQTLPEGISGYAGRAADYEQHPTHDAWWDERSNLHPDGPESGLTIPILANTGFFDIESPGPFSAYRLSRDAGTHLIVYGGHDGGAPGSTPAYRDASQRWFDHYLRGIDNGIDREPSVDLWIPVGGHDELLAGRVEKRSGSNWPLPQTRWTPFYFAPDGTLAEHAPAAAVTQRYAYHPSDPLAADANNTSGLAAGAGAQPVLDAIPNHIEMTASEPTALTYTTAPFDKAVTIAGPGSVDLTASTTAPETDYVAVLADVFPDGTAHQVALGRLRSSYPGLDERLTIRDHDGTIVGPVGDFTKKIAIAPLTVQRYHVELWPFGNRFEAGHRLRVYLLGTPLTMAPAPPAVNSVVTGGPQASRLVLPVLPG